MALSLSRAAVARIAPLAAYAAISVIGPWADVERLRCDVAALAVAGTLLALNRRGYGELVRQTWPTRAELTLAAGAGIVLFVLATQLVAYTIGAPPLGYAPLDVTGAMNWPAFVVHALVFVLILPLAEELFWRSFLMRWLQQAQFESVIPQRVGLKAIVLATFLYALAHPHWLAAALAGLVYALLFLRTGRLWAPIVAHVTANAALCAWVATTGRWTIW